MTATTRRKRRRSALRKWGERLAWAALGAVLLVVFLVAGSYVSAPLSARGRLYDQPAEVPPHEVGLVFGCDERIGGKANPYFRYRIAAAVELWEAGKVRTFIVSGDNRTRYYNEPQKMKRALVRRGVPAERIVCDYAGLRTLDSVVRANEIFGAKKVVFISQKFHNERAIYLARAQGMEAIGYNARDVGGRSASRMRMREAGARVKMWLDVHLLGTEPRHLGERERLPD